MTSIDEIERLLGQIPLPSVVEGPHREQLKDQLLMQPLPKLEKKKKMTISLFDRLSPALKIAAVLLAAATLVGAGWGAEKIYEKLKFAQASLTLEEQPHQEWTLPNGTKLTTSGSMGTVINPNDPKAIATAQHHHEEMKKLIAQKKYKLLKTFEDEFTGGTEYVYTFIFSDGTQDKMNFSMSLDNVASWDDYQQKKQEQTQHYQEQVNKAIAAGKYRLIDQDVMFLHICEDKVSEKKFRVQRISLPKGQEIALYRPYDVAAKEQATTRPQSTWREHLQAIREGKLELLDVETGFSYTYEVTFEDGTKRIFQYGGSEPLKRSKAK